MYTHRVLLPSEYARLAGMNLDVLLPHLPPEACVLVVEDDTGRVVACTSLFPMWHLEGTQVVAAYQKSPSVVRHLLAGIRETAHDLGVSRIVTAATDDQIRGYMDRLGERLPEATHYVWPMEKES
jgi:hypothetical protein